MYIDYCDSSLFYCAICCKYEHTIYPILYCNPLHADVDVEDGACNSLCRMLNQGMWKRIVQVLCWKWRTGGYYGGDGEHVYNRQSMLLSQYMLGLVIQKLSIFKADLISLAITVPHIQFLPLSASSHKTAILPSTNSRIELKNLTILNLIQLPIKLFNSSCMDDLDEWDTQ